ncbi:MAG: UDP-N-acetylmuramoyl-L-alanine--D-glutamate ligase [Alistipes sp.]|jgi:UDP-N-acetylmuramoylalanine--D-glutamate ligase|nr:UDP-N-acetylmuramoyl-L-alanine--D-glutamate ligase [Alistipes sp.]
MARKFIVVLGGGISGYGSAILAKKEGFEVLLSDAGEIAPRYRERLDEWGVEYEQGGHSTERILTASEVIKSPGIPDKAPIVAALREKGVPVISEMEFACRYMGKAKTICITGSNGKTTTTSLIYKIMRDSGAKVSLGGNIGESFAYSVATEEYDWYVLELSSFQLDGMFRFKADIAVLMNITPDHLDRYDYSFEKYAASKMRITQNQTSRDYFIYSADDEMILRQIEGAEIKAKELPFMVHSAIASGAGDAYLVEEGEAVATVGKRTMRIDTSRLQIKGIHNTYNAMAAVLATMAAGVECEQIERSLYEFSAIEHRLEPVGEFGGVLYINDSKATNVDSVWYALESMTRPTVWIAGGTDKGNDYTPLYDFAKRSVHTLVCMGVDNEKLERSFAGIVPNIISCHTFEEAMRAASGAAQSGDVVLLSPACASFDLFRSYEHRGREFKQWVLDNVKR